MLEEVAYLTIPSVTIIIHVYIHNYIIKSVIYGQYIIVQRDLATLFPLYCIVELFIGTLIL